MVPIRSAIRPLYASRPLQPPLEDIRKRKNSYTIRSKDLSSSSVFPETVSINDNRGTMKSTRV